MLQLLRKLEGHTDRVWTVAWNPSGTILASSGADKSIRLWASTNSDTWTCVSILTDSHSKTIRRLCWSPCGNYLASASFDGTVCLWRRNPIDQTWSTLVNLEGPESEVKSVAWSSDGKYLASCSRDKSIWIWEKATVGSDADEDDAGDRDSAEEWDCADVKIDHNKDVKHIVWHPNHNILASCSYDDTIKLYHADGDDWKCFETLAAHTSTVWSVDFSPSGQYLVSSSDDKTVRVWKNHAHDKLPNIESGSWKCVSVIQGYHSRSIYDVSWSRDGDKIASASGDNSLAVYTRNSNEAQDGDMFVCEDKLSQSHDCDVNCVAWNPRVSGLLASGSDDRTIKLWRYSDNETGTKKPLKLVDEIIKSLSLSSLLSSEQADSESKHELTLNITDCSHLLNFIKTLQRLQTELHQDEEARMIEKLLDLKIRGEGLRPVSISGLKLSESDGVVIEFFVDIIDKTGTIVYKIRMVTDVEKFKLHMPRRGVKLSVVAGELFMLEKTGDLFKIMNDGESKFLLGHLFALSDLKFVEKDLGSKISYIISADRDEKIRISNYPDTFNIERYCFGHKHHVKRLLIVDSERFVSIDQQNEICLWNLNDLKDDSLKNKPLLPQRHNLNLDEAASKRICVQ